MSAWVVLTRPEGAAAAVRAAAAGGAVTVLAVGPRELADAVASAGADEVLWLEPQPGFAIESCAPQVADLVAADSPQLVVGGVEPQVRALLGAVAARLGAAVLSEVSTVRADGMSFVLERAGLGGAVVQGVRTVGPVVALLAADEDEPVDGTAVGVRAAEAGATAPVRVVRTQAAATADGLGTALTVVSVGRGLRSRDDLAMVEQLAAALDAQIGCSMPVADDLGWVPKDHYVGRSGQQIGPRLYLALGISGAPQHLEGIRRAKVVVAVNSDPAAPIFRRADYGVVGDLYEVVPALLDALGH
ncbi:MAG: electron transfer flavoprotein subunit alpha/FixB family protein [Actinobacteria bacterium]|nr:electron transfer flavoprotein subunit alpha/FixB family protein [Actinomycetota bacterium]